MTKKYYYKAMSKDMLGFNSVYFKIGETYTIDSEELELCSDNVFTICERLEDTIDYYGEITDRHFLIEVLGDIVTDGVKIISNKIRIVREISRDEIEEHIQDKSSLNAKLFLALYTTNIKILEILSKDFYEFVREKVSENVSTPSHILEELSKYEDWIVRDNVAVHLNTPIHILVKLSQDNKLWVRSGVASNPNTPVHILEKLAKDEDLWVREVVALNPNTPSCLLKELSKDEYWKVRYLVAINSNTPPNIIELLVKDENKSVKKKAQARLKEITQ